MPQLVKGAKWAFGWAVVGADGTLPIPPDAWREYGFRAGEEALVLPGSRRSGGFSISTAVLLAGAPHLRILGRGRFVAGGAVTLPPEAGVRPGDRLLAVRGSGRGLGFVARGPIYDEALRQSHRLAVFTRDPTSPDPPR
ncbi:MAG: hypothetical protein PVG11_05640 [Anaerolineae bacterium]|jgi:hypothetical protein